MLVLSLHLTTEAFPIFLKDESGKVFVIFILTARQKEREGRHDREKKRGKLKQRTCFSASIVHTWTPVLASLVEMT